MNEQVKMDIIKVMELMPHRYPMLLVDRILELNDDRVVGIKNVTINEPFFSGHFPGHPIMPGVLIVESMAQTGGFLLMHKVDQPEQKVVYFLGIDGVKFRKPVLPGDTLTHELVLEKYRHGICKMKGTARVDGEVVCEGYFTAKVIDK
jgi:UDP-3-O-[3-hydroxymyristoyl] N-acetylglucosamine deacetylase / 3-hydroxyacyl-[acyl-carrier-protein] dehydratase